MKTICLILLSLLLYEIGSAQVSIHFINPPNEVFPTDTYFSVNEKIWDALWNVANGSFS